MSSEEKNIQVTHDAENTKYVLTVDGQEAGAAHYVNVADGVRDFNHTVVDDAFRGQGLSKPLISSALDQSREDGVKVIATCPAVRKLVRTTGAYKDIIIKTSDLEQDSKSLRMLSSTKTPRE